MRYPTPSDYVDALQFPDAAFLDPELARGEVESNALGLPRVITGAYAAVFRIRTGDNDFAVRCFLTDAADRRRRYRAIARHLSEHGSLPITPCEFQEEGVRVGEEVFPLVKMPWAAGEGLDGFVERHREDRDILKALREAWRAMLADLAEARVAHGDLQHGNVLVARDGADVRLHLVDLDAMWVPALAGRPSAEVGHRNYQHPDRTDEDDGPWLDHFPGLVVYAALTALIERPELWQRYSSGENLLFQSEDFFDPASSDLLRELRAMEPTKPLAEALERACHLPPAGVPRLEEVLAGKMPTTWRLGTPRRSTTEVPRRSGIEHWALPVTVVAMLLAAVLASTGSWIEAVLIMLGTGVLVIGGALAAYRQLSTVRRRQRIRTEESVLRQWIADLEDDGAELRREREAFVADAGKLREERLRELQDAALEMRLKHHFIGELADDLQVGHRAVIRLKAAGVRNAFHATDENLVGARDLTSDQRAAVATWRETLVRRYEADIPGELSPAEEQRLRRMVERRLEGIASEIKRVEARIAVQEQELMQVQQQAASLPRITLSSYLAYLLRLRPRPEIQASDSHSSDSTSIGGRSRYQS